MASEMLSTHLDYARFADELRKEFNRSLPGEGTKRAMIGKFTDHFIERLMERVDPDFREKMITNLVKYVGNNQRRLTGLIGEHETVKIQASKYTVVLDLKKGVPSPSNNDGLQYVVHFHTVYPTDTL